MCIRDRLKDEYAAAFRNGTFTKDTATSYTPNIPTTYWTFRLMMGLGFVGIAISLLTLWATRRGAKADQLAPKWWHWAIVAAPFMPLFANSFGWIFTEVGRQPWIVHNLMTVENAVSPRVTACLLYTSRCV